MLGDPSFLWIFMFLGTSRSINRGLWRRKVSGVGRVESEACVNMADKPQPSTSGIKRKRVPKQCKVYYSALEIAQIILEGNTDSDRESNYSSDDSLDGEGEESVVRTVMLTLVLFWEAKHKERRELNLSQSMRPAATQWTLEASHRSVGALRKVRGEQQRLFLASHVEHRGGVAGLEHKVACVAEAEAEDGFHQQVGVEEGEGFGTLMKLHLLPQIINSLKSLCLLVSLGSRKMLMVTYQLTTTACSHQWFHWLFGYRNQQICCTNSSSSKGKRANQSTFTPQWMGACR